MKHIVESAIHGCFMPFWDQIQFGKAKLFSLSCKFQRKAEPSCHLLEFGPLSACIC